MMNKLFYGDNLHVLREHIANESVDLIYLDPPFNSNANYNILFKSPKGLASDSQIEAFEDTWHYGEQAAQAFHNVMSSGNTDVANLLRAMQGFLGESDMMAYLAMMAVRLIELHRVLKPTGSLYLHCDPTASHYLKLLLDGVFGAGNYRNEIVWLRTNAHNMRSRGWPRGNDILLFYSKSDRFFFDQPYGQFSEAQLKRYRADADGRLDTGQDLTFSVANPDRQFEWRGTTPPANRSWGASLEQLEAWWADGLILTKQDGTPRLDGRKVFLDEKRGKPLDTNWIDIPRLGNTSDERLGYPTQKPLGLLERIIGASSQPGDVVLDPFCGCGTAIHGAQKMGRQWIGIDVTYLAIGLIDRRLREAFPDIRFDIVGEPKGQMDAEHLAATEPHQFQYWITQKIGGQPYRGGRKGADRGIDGYVYYTRNDSASRRSGTAAAIVSVKAGRNVGVAMVRELKGVLEREKADLGIFVCAAPPTRDMEREAVAAGIWVDPVTGTGYRRVQIFKLADLFAGRMPKLPLLDRQTGYRQARREDRHVQPQLF